MTTDTDADDAVRALSNALLTMLEQQTTPPCVDGTDRWLDEDHEIRATVAPVCDECEIFHQCHDFADTARPRISFGVFGGHDYTVTTRQRHDPHP